MSSLLFRQLEKKDLSALVEICQGHLRPQFNWTEGKLFDELSLGFGFSASDHDLVVSFVIFRSVADVAEVIVLASRPGRQRQGAMRALLGFAIENLTAARSHERIWLEVHAHNKPALNLYESLNFKEVGRRSRYYPDGGEAILLERIL